MIIVSQGATRRSPLSALGCNCRKLKVSQLFESIACDVERTQARPAVARGPQSLGLRSFRGLVQ
ncbi:hypothetical protein QUB05_27325 [Microcoleus sp. F10-C6]|uniref:hypothetical protein n=1 Tax=unclassified Microcoleus TaxID=2642155 RepID=UPI002FD736FE